MKTTGMIALAGAAVCCASASAAEVTVRIENLNASGGFAFTPFFLGFHDGSFDLFNAASPGGAGITSIAELGATATAESEFMTAAPTGFATTFAEPNGPPVFSPGESASMTFDIGDASINRFFHFASMVVPSNDLFIGNDAGIALFDGGGGFNGPLVLDILGTNVWDNGSEVNDITNGPAFVQGVDATGGAAENSVVRPFFTQPGDQDYLDSIIGTVTAPGDVITNSFGPNDVIARITIIPSPAALALLALGGVPAARRRRR